MTSIRSAAVIGAGTMGSGIAGHLSNAGVPVVLLDLPPQQSSNRNEVAARAIERLGKSAALMHQDNAQLITPGNIEDDLELLGSVDWIAEAVVERLEVKEALYREIDQVRRPGSIVSSNTSTIPLATLTRHMPLSFQQDFCVTHFFNPVRYMRLLEIVAGPQTRPEVIEQLSAFCDVQLGKGIVHCKDTPGFLGNRIGVYAIQCAIEAAIESGLTVEQADAVMGRPLGFPKTGVFALYDLIGLDLMIDVVKCLRMALPSEDPFNQLAAELPIINELVARGFTGDKGQGGFFRVHEQQKEAIDLRTGKYRPVTPPELDAMRLVESRGLRALLEDDSTTGRFAAHVLSKTLSYAASLVPEVSDNLLPIDEAMKLGFNWTQGPFEMIDQLGTDWFASLLAARDEPIPKIFSTGGPMYQLGNGRVRHVTIGGDYADMKRLPGVVRLSDLTKPQRAITKNESASVWDVGDDVACVEFHTKANALDPHSMEMVREALAIVKDGFRALLIHNDGPHFSMGVNLQFVLDAARRSAWQEIETMIVEFQNTCQAMKHAPFPVVGAPGGMALGGGFEVLLHCDALYAHANTVVGLVETRVGLIPAGGGCTEMLMRWSDLKDTPSAAARVFELIGHAITAGSPLEASPLRFFREHDKWVMNRDRVLSGAKDMALALATNYVAPEAKSMDAGGADARSEMAATIERLHEQGRLPPHDRVVGKALSRILAGGDESGARHLTEKDYHNLERESFLELIQTPETQARIAHTLNTGKPLRN